MNENSDRRDRSTNKRNREKVHKEINYELSPIEMIIDIDGTFNIIK